jgi:hypothetical protein
MYGLLNEAKTGTCVRMRLGWVDIWSSEWCSDFIILAAALGAGFVSAFFPSLL